MMCSTVLINYSCHLEKSIDEEQAEVMMVVATATSNDLAKSSSNLLTIWCCTVELRHGVGVPGGVGGQGHLLTV